MGLRRRRTAVREPLTWVELLAAFVVSHAVGDYLLQTEWQALHKRGGLSRTGVSRRALTSHVASYTAAFLPAFARLWPAMGPETLGVAALVAAPHLVQDDGRLLAVYARIVKGADLSANASLAASLDQAFHLLSLYLVAYSLRAELSGSGSAG